MNQHRNIILVGNPNSGKTSLFNLLTGLNHKVGNYPGVTVDRKIGHAHLDASTLVNIIDLPGTYSLYPKGEDEVIAYKSLLQAETTDQAAVVVLVLDSTNLQRSLFLATQVIDLNLPTVVALTMMDEAAAAGMQVDVEALSTYLSVPVVTVNARHGDGLKDLKAATQAMLEQPQLPTKTFYHIPDQYLDAFPTSTHAPSSIYTQFHQLYNEFQLHTSNVSLPFTEIQSAEVLERYKGIKEQMDTLVSVPAEQQKSSSLERTYKIDKWLLHPFWGMLILLVVMLTVFQSVFWLASYPMDWIDANFSALGAWVGAQLPETWWSDLLVNGIIAGLGGVVIFVPQIAILFFMLTILEDTGYMARISFLMDRLFQKFGLSGKSVVPMISGMACAIPAVMAARTIENKKHRLITILVTPFMSCTARLPVYAILITMVIPETYVFGFIGLQGLVLLGLYLLGFVTALMVSSVLNRILFKDETGYFIQELPTYKSPRWKNALIEMVDKAKVFLLQAGKVILMISIVLWFLSSYGPTSDRQPIHDSYAALAAEQGELTPAQAQEMSSALLETSYAGMLGKTIEPVIAPLGYDWKIGIALLASFAAREVFVGTMATIYAVGDVEEDDAPLREKMLSAKRPDGSPVYTFATGMSLMIFYAFAMQCMATLAVVKREAGGWKMALLQLFMMSGIAYIAALITYQLLK